MKMEKLFCFMLDKIAKSFIIKVIKNKEKKRWLTKEETY